ncbi:hypothetical protein [uncultured Bifidobacterium sp.]|jgi:FtsZ-binding cell division protein ZapB|uniref:hypothetical protein n=1 Tax=uncultured Bifidobacterium sp. TaxID=165187 RepID=UPI0027DBF911|nr:hypothetical protein [uncultured Bifidobacterium sp.]
MGGNLLPYCHKVLPASFDDALSYYEVICKLTEKVNEVIDFNNGIQGQIDSVNDKLNQVDGDISSIRSDISELSERVENYKSELLGLITELYDLLRHLAKGMQQWDCQLGVYTDTMHSQRDMFNDITVHGITCDDLTDTVNTVDALADCGLNVRGLAVMGLWLVDNFDIPEYFKYRAGGESGGVEGAITVMDLRDGIINKEGYFIRGN